MLTRLGRLSLAAGLVVSVAACDHGDVPALRERAQQAWSEVQNQYRQRAEQVLPLVETVRKKAPTEREVLGEVMAARNEVIAILNADGFIGEPERFRHYEEAQHRLSAALGNLYETIVRYPELTGDTRLKVQLEEFQRLEDRLVVARSDLASAVREEHDRTRVVTLGETSAPIEQRRPDVVILIHVVLRGSPIVRDGRNRS